MSCTVYVDHKISGLINVRSPYNRAFATAARDSGGRWNRDAKVWQFRLDPGNTTLDTVASFCRGFYDGVSIVRGGADVAAPTVDAGFVGKVGGKVTVMVQVLKVVDSDGGAYGPTRFHIMRDTAGHVFVWRASSARYDAHEIITLTGTVKAHEPYKNVSQTVLTRCTLVQKWPATAFIDAQQAVIVDTTTAAVPQVGATVAEVALNADSFEDELLREECGF